MKTREALIAHLKGLGILNSPRLEEAFRRIDRARYVPSGTRSTVAFMLDLLDVKQWNILTRGVSSLCPWVGKSAK